MPVPPIRMIQLLIVVTCLSSESPLLKAQVASSRFDDPVNAPSSGSRIRQLPFLPLDAGPPSAISEVADSQSVVDQEDLVGRKYVRPGELPAAPFGLEELLNSPGAEQEALDGLTLDVLLEMACQNNPTLVQARMQVSGTFGRAIQAGLWPNPVFNYVGEQIGVGGTPGEFQGGIVQQEIVTAHKRRLSRAKYLQRARVAELLAVAQQWRVCNDVRIHFWRTLGHRKVVDIRKELLKSSEDVAITARERWNLGQITRSQLRFADVELQTARLQLLQAENRYRRSFRTLAAMVGTELSIQPLQGDLEIDSERIEFEAALVRLYEESPEVLAARAKWRADQITLQREKVEPIPNLIVRGGAGYNFEAKETTAVAELAFEVPLWDRNQGTIQQAQADLQRQGQEIRRTELRLRQQLAQQYEEYLNAEQQVTQLRDVILPESRLAYQAELGAYQAQRQNWNDVLTVQSRYFDLRRQYVEQLIAVRTNEVLINGYLLHDGLNAPSRPVPPGHIDSVPQPR